jgi:hypothetical protein
MYEYIQIESHLWKWLAKRVKLGFVWRRDQRNTAACQWFTCCPSTPVDINLRGKPIVLKTLVSAFGLISKISKSSRNKQFTYISCVWQLIMDNSSDIIKVHAPCKTISRYQNGILTFTKTIHSLKERKKTSMLNNARIRNCYFIWPWQGRDRGPI